MQSRATKSPSVFSPRSTSSPLPSTNATSATGSSGISQLLFSDDETEDGGVISVDVNSEHVFEIAVGITPVCPAVTAPDEAAGTSSSSVRSAVTATDEAAGTSSSSVRPAVTATDEAAGTSSSSVHPAVTAAHEAAGTSSSSVRPAVTAPMKPQEHLHHPCIPL